MELTFSSFKQSKKQWNNQHTQDHECQRHNLGIWADTNANKALFTDQASMTGHRYMTGINMSYVCNDSASASAALLLASQLSQALCSSTHAILADLLCFSNTERAATLGCGSPKFHSQVLTSYTWLPLGKTISKLGTTYSTYETLAWLRLLDLYLTPVKHAVTNVTYDLHIIYLLVFCLWFTYANHVRLYHSWFTYDWFMIYIRFTYVLLMFYLWSTYSTTYNLLMQIHVFFYNSWFT